MSLLEDVFLEDEAGEAQELERIIEGDEYDDRPRPSTPDSNENSEKEDEAEEDKRHVDPTSAKPKHIVKNPRVILNPTRLTGPRGIQVIPEHFKDFKFKGKGHEKEDLDVVLKKLEHWAYRLYPKFVFKDCLKKIETLGNKRPVVVHLTKIRTDQFISEETVVQRDSSDDEAVPEPVDEFDKLLQQQIDLARATPAPGTGGKGFTTPMVERSIIMPKATSSPSINDEQRERMLRNRQLAEERRLARIKLNNSATGHEYTINNTENNSEYIANIANNTLENNSRVNVANKDDINDITKENLTSETKNTKINDNTANKDVTQEENITKTKSNRSNVIDSSDSEDDGLVINESVAVDVHNIRNNYSDDESDIGNQNGNDKEVNTDKVHQDELDEINNDTVHHHENAKETNSDMVYENENHSDIDNQNTAKEFVDDTNDIEMNDDDNRNDSKKSKNDQNIKNSDIEIEETPTNQGIVEKTMPNDNSSVVSKQISEIDEQSQNLVGQSTENIELTEKSKEIGLDVDDIMDVDFSDDF